MIDLALSKEKAIPIQLWGMLYEGWTPEPEKEGRTVFMQGYENRGPDNERKKIYMSATTPDLIATKYRDKITGFYERLLADTNADTPLMHHYFENYFDLYWSLHVGATGLGILRAAPAVGALLGAAFITRHPIRGHAGRTLLIVVGLYGASIVVFGLSRVFLVSLLALAVGWFVDLYSMNIRSTTVALASPDRLRGRVNAVEMVFISASNQLGAFESGLAAFLVGTVPAVVGGGVMTMLIAVTWRRFFPALPEVDRLEDVTAPDPNEEYMLYQTLLGAWPLEPSSAEEYAAFVKRIEREMYAASEALDFEKAARLRDDLGALNRALEKQAVVLGDGTDADVIALEDDPLEVAVLDPDRPTAALDRGVHRGLGAEAERIDDPLLRVLERLRPYLEMMRAVRFAYQGSDTQ